MLGEILIAGIASLTLCMFLGPKFIEYLREKEFGQQIREEGPAGHATKAGTPTMGGLLIMVSVVVPFLILGQFDTETLAVVGTMLASAALGFADDWMKITRRRSLGLSGKTKIGVQLVISVALWYVATHTGPHLTDTVRFRISNASVNIGYAYPVLIFLVLDGLDGLAAGCAAIVLLAYIAITFITGENELAMLAGCLVGGCIGFLWFNAFPATIFMGDTGSLGLGGAIAGLAVMTKTEVLLLITGGIFVIEALSVLIQVIAFQRFRRRVFLMAPVHHHFELMAWSETKIILRFWIIAAISAAIGFTLYQQSIT